MADIITTQDLSVEDTSKLKTGDMKRSYNMAKHPGGCPSGQHKVKGKCIPKGRTAEEVQKMPTKTVKGIKYHVDEKGTPVASTKLSRTKTYVEKRQEYLQTPEGKTAIDRLIKKHKAHGGK